MQIQKFLICMSQPQKQRPLSPFPNKVQPIISVYQLFGPGPVGQYILACQSMTHTVSCEGTHAPHWVDLLWSVDVSTVDATSSFPSSVRTVCCRQGLLPFSPGPEREETCSRDPVNDGSQWWAMWTDRKDGCWQPLRFGSCSWSIIWQRLRCKGLQSQCLRTKQRSEAARMCKAWDWQGSHRCQRNSLRLGSSSELCYELKSKKCSLCG